MAVMQRPAFLLSLLFCLVFEVYSYDGERKEAPPDFEERFLALASRVEQLESRDRLQQAEIESLKTELSAEKQRSTRLELLVKNLWTRKPSVPVSDQATTGSDHVTQDFDDEVHREPTTLTGTNLAQRIRRAENEQTVAFYALKSSHALHTGQNQNIVFETVVTNVGGAYINSLGVFQAPVDGIYVFSVHLMAYSTQTERYHLSKNSKPVCNLYVRATESPNTVTSQTAILRLTKGDNVEVQTAEADGSVNGSGYSSFAGFLLQQDYGSPAVVGK